MVVTLKPCDCCVVFVQPSTTHIFLKGYSTPNWKFSPMLLPCCSKPVKLLSIFGTQLKIFWIKPGGLWLSLWLPNHFHCLGPEKYERRHQNSPSATSGSTVMALRWHRGDELLNKLLLFYFFCIQKVFSSLHKIQIEPLMADGLFWRCLSYFSGPWLCYLLGSQWDSYKPPGFHPKYLQLCSEDELLRVWNDMGVSD